MLALSRNVNDAIQIGPNVRVMVLAVRGNQVRLGIDAPRNVKILRSELLWAENRYATPPPADFSALLKHEISNCEPELSPGLARALELFERGRAERVSNNFTNEELANYCEGVNGPAWRAYAGMVEAGEIKSYHDLNGVIRPDIFAQVETYFSGGRHVS